MNILFKRKFKKILCFFAICSITSMIVASSFVSLSSGKKDNIESKSINDHVNTLENSYDNQMLFDNAKASDVLSVSWAKTTFKGPFNANDFLGKYPEFNNQYMYPSVWDMQWGKGTFEKAVKQYIISKGVYLPSGFSTSNFTIQNISTNDATGELNIEFLLSKYIDKSGNVINSLPSADSSGKQPTPFRITIIGFKKSQGETSLVSEYNLTSSDSIFNKVYEESFDDEIKNIVSGLIVNSPINFLLESNKKYINYRINPNIESAYVDVDVNFQGYFNQSKKFLANDFFNKTIRIKGFKSSILTEINTSNLNLGNPEDIAQIAINDSYIIDNIILKNDLIINPSLTFNRANIIIQNITFNNKEGFLNFDLSLNKYTNNDGVETEIGFIPVNMNITGYKKVQGKTHFSSSTYNIANSFQNAYDFVTNPQKIIDLISPHLLNKVQEYSSTFPSTILSIKEDSIVPNFEEGKIAFVPVIKNYFDGDTYEFINNSKELPLIEITGFRKVGETRINENANFVLGNPNILPSFFFENEQEKLKTYVFDRLIFKPDQMTSNDILIQSNSSYSNIEGSITLYVKFAVWYDANGALQTEPSTKVSKVIISGFRRVKPTTIINTFLVSEYNLLPSDVINDEDYLKEIVINNLINNIVSNTTKQNIKLSNLVANNLDGVVEFNVSLNKYYNDDGTVYDGPDFKLWNDKVVISGFKTISPTKLPSNNVWETDLIDSLAETVSKDITTLKKTVFNKIIGSIPNNFDINDNIDIQNITFSNLNGTIDFDVNLTLFFDDMGNIKTSLPKLYHAKIVGFRTIVPTTISNIVKVTGYSNILPTDISKDQLINIIFNNYSSFYQNLPINHFTKDNIIVSEDSINAVNSLGSIDILLSTSTYYDQNGNLVLNDSSRPLDYRKVTILGFNSISETIINSGVAIPNVSDIFASDVTNSQLVDYLFNHKDIIFSPLPSTFSRDSITILNPDGIIKNNLEGSITFDLSILDYYNSLGSVESVTPKTVDRFVITGFKTSSPTSFDSQVHLPKEDVGNLFASSIENDQLLSILRKNKELFVRSFPPEFQIQSINVLENSVSNLIGSLIVEITYVNFYNQSGILISSPEKTTIRCYGFKTASPTLIKSEFTVTGKNDLLPSSQKIADIRKIIMSNKDSIFDSLPESIAEDDIIVEVDENSYINSQGQIIVNIKLNKYYDESSKLIVVSPQNPNLNPLTGQIILSGFLSISPTTIKEKVLVLDEKLISKFATDVSNEELVKYVYDNRENIITSIPNDFSIDNISINDNIYSNNQGIIIAKISLTSYYDSSSQHVTTGFEPKTIIFEGFKKNNKVSYIQPTLFLNSPSIQSQPAHSITYSKFLDYVYENNLIKDVPSTFSRSDLLPGTSDNFIEINNLEGYVTAKVSIKNYYDYQGNIVNNPTKPLSGTISIYGFKKILPTEVISYYNSESFSHKLATEETEENLLKVVKNSSGLFISKEPTTFNPQSDIVKIKINNSNNLDGTINATLYINNYYDNSGNIFRVQNPNDPNQLMLLKAWNITFAGYRKLTPTNINKYFIIDETNTLPNDVNEEEIKNIIFNNRNSIFNNLPKSGITDSDFDVKITNSSNLRGEINVNIKLYKYINEIGNLVTKEDAGLNSPMMQNILIKGFKSVSPTSSINEISAADLNSSLVNSLPHNVSNEEIVDFIIKNQKRIIYNIPVPLDIKNFTTDNIISVAPINSDGILKVKFAIKNYYNELGELILDADLSNAKIFDLDIIDLTQIGSTSSINFFSVPSVPNDKTPQDLYLDKQYLSSIINQYKNEIFTNLPSNLTENDFIISNQSFSNIDGTISLLVSLSKYYDKNGNFINSNSNQKTFEITLGGYRTTKSTIFNSQIAVIGYESISPSEFLKANNDLRDLIFDNRSSIFSNLSNLSSFTKDSIVIKGATPFDSSGKLVIDYSINNYYDSSGVLTTQLSEKKQLVITGFFSNPVTNIIQNVQVNYKDKKPSEFFNQSSSTKEYQIQKFIFENQSLFFENLPTGNNAISMDDIIIIHNSVFANDKEGYIKFNLSLSKYYDSFGTLQTTPSEPKQIIITGFASQAATSIGDFNTFFSKNGGVVNASIGNDYLTVDEFLNVDNPREKIESLIVSSILNSNGEANNKGVLGFKSYDVDKNNGIIIVNDLRLTDFFDAESGELISNPDGVSFTLVIKGFKTIFSSDVSTPDIFIYVSIGVTSAIILSIIIYFIFKFIRYKYFKI